MKDSSSNKITRRGFLRISMLGGALLLSACGGLKAEEATRNQSTGTKTSGSSGNSQKVSLAFWLPGGSDIYLQAHRKIAKEYQEKHPGVTVKIQRHTGDQNYQEVLLARIAGGNPPDATVIWETPVSYGVRGAVLQMDSMMASSRNAQAENWPSNVLASCQFDNKTYGLPVTAGTYALWYDQEMFEKQGLPATPDDMPKTWDEMRKLSKEFVSWNGNKLQTAGFVPDGQANISAAVLPIWSALNGSHTYDAENRKYTIDSERNVAMMEYFVSWLDEQYKGDINKVYSSANWGGYDGTTGPVKGEPAAFQAGRLAMMLEGSWMMGDFYAVKAKFKHWNVAPLPVGPDGSKEVSGDWPNWLAIPKGAAHSKEIFDYLDYMSVDGVKVWFSAVPDLPVNKKVPNNLMPELLAQKRGKDFALTTTNFFRKQLESATPMWNSPVESFSSDQIDRAIQQILAKASKPKDALAEAQNTSQQQLQKVLSS